MPARTASVSNWYLSVITTPSPQNKKPDQLARTGLWLALAVFICLPALAGGARKLIFKSAQTESYLLGGNLSTLSIANQQPPDSDRAAWPPVRSACYRPGAALRRRRDIPASHRR